MVYDLKQVFDIPGESLSFHDSMDLSNENLFGTRPFITPVVAAGQITNRAGIVMLTYQMDFVLALSCDRCLTDIKRDFHYDFTHVLALETENDEYVSVYDFKLDLTELCLSDLFLSLPTKILCKEDCQGLCPKCGVDLNLGDCACVKKEIDPRLAIWGDLL